MPTVLLTIESRDQSSAVLQRVQQALAQVDRQLQSQGVSARQVIAAVQQQDSAYTKYASTQDRVAAALARYESASRRALAADQQRQQILSSLGSGTDQYTRAADSATTATQRQAEAGMRLADAYRSQADAAERAAAAAARVKTVTSAPMSTAESTSSGGGLGGVGSSLLIGGAYMASYMALSAVTNSVSRSAAYSRAVGTTAAETGLTPAQTKALDSQITAYAASGNEPYDRTTLMQGSYALASLGIGKNTSNQAGAVGQITQLAAQSSAAAGSADMSASGDAIVSLINDFNLNNKDVVGNARKLADQLQVAVKLGKAEMGQFASSVAVPAQMASQLGVSSGSLLGFMSAESAGGIANTDLSQPTYALLASSLRPTNVQSRAAKGLGINYNSSFWGGPGGIAGGASTIERAMQSRGLNQQQQLTALTALFGDQAAAKGFMAAQNAGGLQGVSQQVQNSQGAVQSAYATSQAASGAQLQNAETKLATSFDQLTTTALPGLVTALGAAAASLDLITNQGKTTASNPAGASAADTLRDFLTPGGKNFLNLSGARDQAARGQGSTGWGSIVGSAFDSALNAVGLGPGSSGIAANPHPTGGTGPGGIPMTSLELAGYGGAGAGKFGSAASSYGGPRGADWVTNFAGPGRGAVGGKDADMTRFANNVQIAIQQGQSAATVQSALGLYVAAAKANPALSGSQRTLDILGEEKLVNKYLGAANAAATSMPFHTQNPGQGGLDAGFQNTAVRFGGGPDAQARLIAKLEQQLARADKQIALLQQIVGNTAHTQNNTARISPLAGKGTNRGSHL